MHLLMRPRVLLSLLTVICLTVGIRMCIQNIKRSRWLKTESKNLKFNMKVHDSEAAPPLFKVTASYQYEVDTLTFEGDRVTETTPAIMTAREITRHFGSTKPEVVPVYYHPLRQTECLLVKPDLRARWAIAAALCALGTFFLGVLIYYLQRG